MDPLPSILVVDDEPDIRQLLATILRRAGYQVATAEGSLQALDVLQRTPYTLVITDLMMPGIDGLELLRRIADRHPVTRGIVLTGYGSIQSAVEATKLGADNYITKPIVIDEFLQAVRSTLESGQPLRPALSATSEVSALADLTRLLAQPALDLQQMIQGATDVVAVMLHAHARIRIVDQSMASEIAMAESGTHPSLPLLGVATSTIGFAPAGQRGADHLGHVLTTSLETSHGYGGSLHVSRPADSPPFSRADGQILQVASNQLNAALGYLLAGRSLALTLREMRELSLQTVRALVRAVELRDYYTAGHSARVSRYAVALARSLGLDVAEVENVRIAGLLHDVGKIGISDLLLNKPGPLTPADRARIEEHPALGCQIVATVQSLAASVPLIMHHQELYDGQGYPARLAGEQIPYGARILSVADSFEAMTADRAYRKARSVADALAILAAGAGRQWDPLLVARWRQIASRVLTQPQPPTEDDG
jgi:putative nucleotidyltransferase with HDIG domain